MLVLSLCFPLLMTKSTTKFPQDFVCNKCYYKEIFALNISWAFTPLFTLPCVLKIHLTKYTTLSENFRLKPYKLLDLGWVEAICALHPTWGQ